MLLIVAVLAAFLANNCALGTFPQLDTKTRTVLNLTEVNSTFTKLNEEWMYKLIWDENITRDALLEAIQQHIATADFKIRGKKAFMKSLKNETTMAQKVEEAMVFPFVRAHKFGIETYLGNGNLYFRRELVLSYHPGSNAGAARKWSANLQKWRNDFDDKTHSGRPLEIDNVGVDHLEIRKLMQALL